MKIKNKKLYPNHDFIGQNEYCSDTYIGYTCVGIHFEDISAKPLYFFDCYFYGCTFGTNGLCVFEVCRFDHCDFKGTFRATLVACSFADKTHVPYMPMACPTEGEFIGWKVCRKSNTDRTPYLVKLCIPEDAERTSGFGSRKCRCNRACVLNILNIDGSQPRVGKVVSYWDGKFSYSKGQWVHVNDYDGDRREVCSAGINFFVERQEAINYYESEFV